MNERLRLPSAYESKEQDDYGLFLRTLECSKCKKFDGVYISKKELNELINNNDLEIGSVIVNHGDHERVIYFLPDGSYLGDSIIEVEEIIEEPMTNNRKKVGLLTKFRKTILSALFGKHIKISITGSSQVGKTTLARYLTTGKPLKDMMDVSLPTLGKSIKKIKIGKSSITIYDLGGQQDFWKIWSDSIIDSDFYIHIIDGTRINDEKQIKALEYLGKIVKNSDVSGIILVNKIDRLLTGEVNDFLRAKEIESLTNQFGINANVVEVSLFEGIAYINVDDYLEERDLLEYLKELLKNI